MNVRVWKLMWIAPLAIIGMLLFAGLGGYIVMRLWNWLTPALFGWHAITFWQAFGLLALCRILFGGFGLHGGPGSRIRGRMRDRWEHMSPEERERFRQGMFGRFGAEPGPGEPTGGPRSL
jgi:hypothetical protein